MYFVYKVYFMYKMYAICCTKSKKMYKTLKSHKTFKTHESVGTPILRQKLIVHKDSLHFFDFDFLVLELSVEQSSAFTASRLQHIGN